MGLQRLPVLTMNLLDQTYPRNPAPPLSIAAQLERAIPIVKANRVIDDATNHDRKLQILEKAREIGNVNATTLERVMPISRVTIQGYLRQLHRERKLLSWRQGNATWYALNNPEPRRGK